MTTNRLHPNHLVPPGRALASLRSWDAGLARQQAIYDELLRARALRPAAPSPGPAEVAESVRELTRELAGWSPQWPQAH